MEFDADKSGSIDATELGAAMTRMGQPKTEQEIQDLIMQVTYLCSPLERRGNNLKGFEDFCLKAATVIWPRLSLMRAILAR